MKLVTVAEMRAIEHEADSNGLSYAKMMENAGHGLAEEIALLAYGELDEKREILALVGSGNNGGDALVALAHLAADGWRARAYLVKRKAEGDELLERFKKEGGEILSVETDPGLTQLTAFIETADVLVDGVLGTGVKLPLKPEVAGVLAAANRAISALNWPPYVVAVDCPSGVDCDSGDAAEETIPASLTVCMAAIKPGLLKFPAFELAGELRVVDIGLTDEIESWGKVSSFVADEDTVEEILPPRLADAHKGTFGTLLVAAGSVSYTGAALLAGKSAYRAGVGLVQMAVPGGVHSALAGHFLEATWILLPNEKGFIAEHAAEVLVKNLGRATALVLGPGFGGEETTQKFIETLLMGNSASRKNLAPMGFIRADAGQPAAEKTLGLPPLIVDADGLRHLAKIKDWAKLLPAETILTPHPGEMAALTGLDKETIQADRLTLALKYALAWGHVVVLKGAFTVIAAPDGRATLIPVATPALARAGTGDVLAGLIGGLRAQGVSAHDAAVAGAWIHAQAGLFAAEKVGAEASVLAGDVMDAIADVLSGF